MKHRFLHTLVFSSVMALEGCGLAPPDVEPAQTAGVQTTGAEVANEAFGASGASSTNRASQGYGSERYGSGSSSASRAPEAVEAEIQTSIDVDPDAIAMRLCEIGWATTKSGRGQVDPWDCSAVDTDGIERTECTDQNGRCVQP